MDIIAMDNRLEIENLKHTCYALEKKYKTLEERFAMLENENARLIKALDDKLTCKPGDRYIPYHVCTPRLGKNAQMIKKLVEENEKLKEALNELYGCFEESHIRVEEGLRTPYVAPYTCQRMDKKLKEAKMIMDSLSDKTKDICYRVKERKNEAKEPAEKAKAKEEAE